MQDSASDVRRNGAPNAVVAEVGTRSIAADAVDLDPAGQIASDRRGRRERARELSALLHGAHDLDTTYRRVLDALAELSMADRVFLALVDAKREVVRVHLVRGAKPDQPAEVEWPLHVRSTTTEGIVARVVRTRRPHLGWSGSRRAQRRVPMPGQTGIRRRVVVPVVSGCETVGALAVEWGHQALTAAEVRDLALLLADHLGAAIAAHRRLALERDHQIVASELHRAGRRIVAEPTVVGALDLALRAVERFLGACSASVDLSEQAGLLPERRYTTGGTGRPHWHQMGFAELSPNSPTGIVLRTGAPFVTSDDRWSDSALGFADEESRTTLSVPISFEDQTFGVLHAHWRVVRECTQQDRDALSTLGEYLAIVIASDRRRASELEVARLDGAILTARTVAHELNNDLALTLGVAEFALSQVRHGRPVDESALERIVRGARRISDHVQQFQELARIAERRYRNLPAILDLVRSRPRSR